MVTTPSEFARRYESTLSPGHTGEDCCGAYSMSPGPSACQHQDRHRGCGADFNGRRRRSSDNAKRRERSNNNDGDDRCWCYSPRPGPGGFGVYYRWTCYTSICRCGMRACVHAEIASLLDLHHGEAHPLFKQWSKKEIKARSTRDSRGRSVHSNYHILAPPCPPNSQVPDK